MNLTLKNVWLFDMDGLLIDTEKLHIRFWKEVLPGDPQMIDELLQHTLGTSGEMAKQVALKYTGDANFMVRHNAQKEALMHAYVESHGLTQKSGAAALLAYLKAHGKQCIVVSSTSYQGVLYSLKKAHLENYFSQYVCGDQVKKTKPDPEIYLKALHDYHINVSEAVVLEDSLNGITAALQAGIDVIGVADLVPITIKDPHLSLYPSLDEVLFSLQKGNH